MCSKMRTMVLCCLPTPQASELESPERIYSRGIDMPQPFALYNCQTSIRINNALPIPFSPLSVLHNVHYMLSQCEHPLTVVMLWQFCSPFMQQLLPHTQANRTSFVGQNIHNADTATATVVLGKRHLGQTCHQHCAQGTILVVNCAMFYLKNHSSFASCQNGQCVPNHSLPVH